MCTTNFFNLLREKLNNNDQKVLIETSRVNPVFLSQLKEEDFFQNVIKEFGNDLSKWSLGKIALFSIGEKMETLAKDVKEKFYLKQAINTLDEALRNPKSEIDFQKATFIALALFERKRKNLPWSGLMDELKNGHSNSITLMAWKPSLTILYSLLNHDDDFLKALIDEKEPFLGIGFVNYIVASQLMTQNEKASRLVKLFENFSVENQIFWMQSIPSQLSFLMDQLSTKINESRLITQNLLSNHENSENYFEDSYKNNLLDGFRFQIENSPLQAQTSFIYAKEKLQKIIKLIDLNIIKNSTESERREILNSFNQTLYYDLIFDPGVDDFRNLNLSAHEIINKGILANLGYACEILKKGETSKAREIGKNQFTKWFETQKHNMYFPETTSYLQKINHSKILEYLTTLGLTGISAEYIQFLRSISFPMEDLRDELINGLVATNHFGDAYSELKLSAVYNGNDAETSKKILSVLKAAKSWNALMDEWDEYSKTFQMTQDDWIDYATVALNADRIDQARNILEMMSSNGTSNSQVKLLQGKIAYKEGDYEKAQEILEETIRILPGFEDGWIVLSDVYSQMGFTQKSFETLRAGVLAIPDSSAIHFALAFHCSKQELYADALPHLKKAVAIEPDNPNYYLQLIPVLQVLGRTDEADGIISLARQKWPREPELAYMDAVRQIEKQNREGALKAFEVLIQTDQDLLPMERLLLYVQTILGDKEDRFLPTDGKYNSINNLISAQKILQNAITGKAEDANYLKVLLGEVYFLIGETEAANSLYSNLLSEFEANSHQKNLSWRIYAGLGLVKIGLSEIDSGIAALQEACQLNPHHLGIKQKIAEAYLEASLISQAEAKAQEIYQSAPTDIENLVWFAAFMEKTGNLENEIKSLEQILHFDATNSYAITKLADIYISNGDVDLAFQTLEKLKEDCLLTEVEIRNVVVSFLRIGKNEEALFWFEKIHSSDLSDQSQWIQLEKVYLLMLNQMWDRSLIEIQTLKRNGTKLRLLSALEGECLLNKKDYAAAVYCFEMAFSSPQDGFVFDLDNPSNDFIIPGNWLMSKVEEQSILFSLTTAYKKAGKLDQSLDAINQMINREPENPWFYILGAENAIEITDYDLVSDYLLKYKNIINSSGAGDGEIFAMALDYSAAYLDGRDYRITFKATKDDEIIKKLLNAHQLLDKNLYEDAYQVYNETVKSSVLRKNERNEPQEQKYAEIKEAVINRLAILLAWRLNDYHNLNFLFDESKSKNDGSVETAFLKLSILIAYRPLVSIFDKLDITVHRNSNIENIMQDLSFQENLVEVINQFGKTKAIKNIEALFHAIRKNEKSELFALLNSKALPGYLNPSLIDFMLKSGQEEVVKEYMSNFKVNLLENIFYLIHQEGNTTFEPITFVESQIPADDPIWLTLCSRAYEQADQINEAVEFAEHGYRIWADEDQWLIRLAKLYEMVGDFEKANECWSAIVKNASHPENVIYQYADLLLENKKPNELLTLLEEYKEKLPESYSFNLVNAKAHLLQKSFHPMLSSIQAARKQMPASTDLDYLEAEAYLLNGEMDKSKKMLQNILITNPRFDKAYILNAKLLRDSEKYSEAIKVVNSGLDKCPGNKGLLIEKVRNMQLLNDYANALMITSELSQKYPKDIDVLQTLAHIYFEIDDIEAAEMVARKSIHINPNQPELNHLLGQVARKQGQLDQALNYFAKASQYPELGVEPWLEMGAIYVDQQEPEKALEAFREASSRDETDYRAYYQSGVLLRDMKDYVGAEKMLKIASSLTPKDINIKRQLAGVIALNLVHSS